MHRSHFLPRMEEDYGRMGQRWEWCHRERLGTTYKEGWCGFFNIPMEVRLMKDSTLQFLPIKEIESLRQGGQFWDNLVVTEDELELKAGDGVTFELKMKIDLEKTDADKLEFTLRCGEGKKTVCMFDFKKAEMTVNRNNADGWSRGISRSVMYLNNKKNWMCIFYLTRVPLKFLRVNIRIIIPIIYLQEIFRIS